MFFSSRVFNRTAFTESNWVIDIGATDHMVCSLTLFTSVTSYHNSIVEFPNGEYALVTHTGTIKVSDSLTLFNVLCVPSFSFNLISVSKLTSSLKCCFLSSLNFVSYRTWSNGKWLDWVKRKEVCISCKIKLLPLILLFQQPLISQFHSIQQIPILIYGIIG